MTCTYSYGRWSMMPRGGFIQPPADRHAGARRLAVGILGTLPRWRKPEDRGQRWLGAVIKPGSTRFLFYLARSSLKEAGRWGVTGERRKLASQPAGPVKARRRPDDSKMFLLGRTPRSPYTRTQGLTPPDLVTTQTRRLRRRRSPSRFCGEQAPSLFVPARNPTKSRSPVSILYIHTDRTRRLRVATRLRHGFAAAPWCPRSRDGDVRLSVTFQDYRLFRMSSLVRLPCNSTTKRR